MCPWTPLDPLDSSFVRTSYKVRMKFARRAHKVPTKCANYARSWPPFAHLLPPLRSNFPLYRHTPLAEKARHTALAAEMAAATGTTASTATSSSSSSTLGPSGAPAPVPVAPAAAQLGAPTGLVGSDLMECTN